MRQREADDGLGGQDDVFVSGEGCPASSGASASSQTDGSAFASASQAADDAAKRSAAAGHHRGTLAFALRRESLYRDSNRKLSTVQVDRVEAYLKLSAAGEPAQRFGINDGAADSRTARNCHCVPHHNVPGYSAGESFAALAQL